MRRHGHHVPRLGWLPVRPRRWAGCGAGARHRLWGCVGPSRHSCPPLRSRGGRPFEEISGQQQTGCPTNPARVAFGKSITCICSIGPFSPLRRNKRDWTMGSSVSKPARQLGQQVTSPALRQGTPSRPPGAARPAPQQEVGPQAARYAPPPASAPLASEAYSESKTQGEKGSATLV